MYDNTMIYTVDSTVDSCLAGVPCRIVLQFSEGSAIEVERHQIMTLEEYNDWQLINEDQREDY